MVERSSPRESGWLVEAFAALADRVHAAPDLPSTLDRITAAAVDAVAGCEAASITVVGPAGPRSHAVTGPLAGSADQVQFDEQAGPCLDAAGRDHWVYVPDMATAAAWPTTSPQLDQLGVGSMLSCRLVLDGGRSQTPVSLTLYARDPGAFSADERILVRLFAALAGVVAEASKKQENLTAAIASRQVIGEAIGILRSQSEVTRDEAFAMLARASQRSNVKLRDLAGHIAEGTMSVDEAR